MPKQKHIPDEELRKKYLSLWGIKCDSELTQDRVLMGLVQQHMKYFEPKLIDINIININQYRREQLDFPLVMDKMKHSYYESFVGEFLKFSKASPDFAYFPIKVYGLSNKGLRAILCLCQGLPLYRR